MIRISFALSNPCSNRWNSIWYKHGRLRKNMVWEFNGYETSDLIDISFQCDITGPHSGFHLMIGLLGYSVEYHLYDTRH